MRQLNNYRVEVNPLKMEHARLSAGLKIIELADKVGLSDTSISKYEKGKSKISKENLDKYSEILNFPIEYFTSDYKIFISEKSPIFFRSNRVTKETYGYYEQKYYHILLVHSVLSDYVNFINYEDNLLPSKYKMKYVDGYGYSSSEIEDIVTSIKSRLDIETGPIDNMLEIVMENGIIVSNISANIKATTDAFTQKINGQPIIFVNKNKRSSVRNRFSLAHEFGHIILHGNVKEEDMKDKDIYNTIESEANRFASCFLLSREEFVEDIITVDIDSLVALKGKWKVSIQAIAMRLKELDIIDERQLRNIFIYISKKGWSTREPLDDIIPSEDYNIYKDVFNMLIKEGIDLQKIISDIGIGKDRIEEICNLNKGFFNIYMNVEERPKLKLIK